MMALRTLTPCQEENKPKFLDGKGICFPSKSQFLQLVEHSYDTFALVILEENKVRNEIPPILKPMLEEFQDMMPDEIGLPPVREIQHHIYFIAGFFTPNKATYHVSPKKHEEPQQ